MCWTNSGVLWCVKSNAMSRPVWIKLNRRQILCTMLQRWLLTGILSAIWAILPDWHFGGLDMNLQQQGCVAQDRIWLQAKTEIMIFSSTQAWYLVYLTALWSAAGFICQMKKWDLLNWVFVHLFSGDIFVGLFLQKITLLLHDSPGENSKSTSTAISTLITCPGYWQSGLDKWSL